MAEGGDAEQHLVVTKGAFSNVLSICTQVEQDGAVFPLTDVVTTELSAYYEAKGKAGFRVLALATRAVVAKEPISATTRREWSSRVFCSSSTRPRPTPPACSATSRRCMSK